MPTFNCNLYRCDNPPFDDAYSSSTSLERSFAGLTAIGIVWSYFYVPETVGRSTIEIDSLFSRSVPARLFRRTDVSSLSSDVVA